MRLYSLQFSLIFFISLLISFQLKAESAYKSVEKIHLEVISVIEENRNHHGSYKENPDVFVNSISSAIEPLVDFKRISRNVMGKHYRSASPEQKIKFSKMFRDSLLETYSKTLAEFENEEILILPEKEGQDKLQRKKIHLKIITDTKIYPAFYDLYLNNQGEWKLINIVINGVNLGVAFRNQFYSMMEKKENDLDAVITNWKSSI